MIKPVARALSNPLTQTCMVMALAGSLLCIHFPDKFPLPQKTPAPATVLLPPADGAHEEPRTEIARIRELLRESLKEEILVYMDGKTYKPRQVMPVVQGYLRMHFESGDTAEEWIREHATFSPKGNMIYFRYPDGSMEPMRDVLLNHLRTLA